MRSADIVLFDWMLVKFNWTFFNWSIKRVKKWHVDELTKLLKISYPTPNVSL